jgi:hypothetical protein
MSGPLPRGEAVIRTEAEWGQGERGAAGYEDSGESGLEATLGSNEPRRGARRTTSAKRQRSSTRQPSTVEARKIPQHQWVQFFNDFSRRHAGWLAEVEVREQGDASRVEARRLPFEGITVDLKPGALDTTSIILEMQTNVHLTHMIPRTRQIYFTENPPQIEIQVIAANGDRTIAHFHSPPREPRLLPPAKSTRTEAG